MAKSAVIDITVSPKSSRSKISMGSDSSIRVYLNSPPVDGKANAECIELFSKKLKTAKSNISIKSGERGRNKRIMIHGFTLDEVMNFLKEAGEK